MFKNETGPFYIIGVHKAIKRFKSILKHEIAHGLFNTDADYRTEVQSALSKFETAPIKVELSSKAAYHDHVLEDECHAYSCFFDGQLDVSIPEELTKQLKTIYKKYVELKNVHFPASIRELCADCIKNDVN